jgi:hypothetical protein
MALGDATRQSFDTTAKMYSDMYGKNLDAMQKAVMMNEGVVKGGTLADQLLGAVGEDRRGMQQTLLDDAIARWEWEQALPAAKLSQYVGAVQGNYGGQSSSNTESEVPQQQTSAIGRIGGAAMSGLGTYAALATAMPMAAPWIGAAIGIASLFR